MDPIRHSSAVLTVGRFRSSPTLTRVTDWASITTSPLPRSTKGGGGEVPRLKRTLQTIWLQPPGVLTAWFARNACFAAELGRPASQQGGRHAREAARRGSRSQAAGEQQRRPPLSVEYWIMHVIVRGWLLCAVLLALFCFRSWRLCGCARCMQKCALDCA